jgi:hypothetical protein
LTERTNAWDAIGVASYGMIFAFTESLVIFLVAVLLGFLTPERWQIDKRVAFLSLLILITAIWGMIGQLFFLWNIFLPPQAIQFLRGSSHPLRIIYMVCLLVVTPAVLLPVYAFMRSNKAVMFMQNLMERLSLLTMLYLFFDLLALMIVAIRNIG